MIQHNKTFLIREFKLGDEEEIYYLFRDTVRNINVSDYSEKQVKAWAPDDVDMDEWRESLLKNYTYVAVNKINGKIVGFADLTSGGELNRGYVHKDYQGQGIGTCLLAAREDKARELGIKKLYSEVSITAKPFFERRGYQVEKPQTRIKSDIEFDVFLMWKDLNKKGKPK